MTLDNNITTAAVATLSACIITATVTWIIFKKNFNASVLKTLDDNLNQMINYSIQYPYLEDSKFIVSWTKNKNSSDEKYLRYEAYCIFVFNFLDRICQYYNYDRKKVEIFIHITEIVRAHAEWWKNPTGQYDNIEGYSEKFRNFINSYLK